MAGVLLRCCLALIPTLGSIWLFSRRTSKQTRPGQGTWRTWRSPLKVEVKNLWEGTSRLYRHWQVNCIRPIPKLWGKVAQLPSIQLNCPLHSRSMRDLSIQSIPPIPGLSYSPDHPVVWENVTCCRPNPGQETWEQINCGTAVLCILGLFSLLVYTAKEVCLAWLLSGQT